MLRQGIDTCSRQNLTDELYAIRGSVRSPNRGLRRRETVRIFRSNRFAHVSSPITLTRDSVADHDPQQQEIAAGDPETLLGVLRPLAGAVRSTCRKAKSGRIPSPPSRRWYDEDDVGERAVYKRIVHRQTHLMASSSCCLNLDSVLLFTSHLSDTAFSGDGAGPVQGASDARPRSPCAVPP